MALTTCKDLKSDLTGLNNLISIIKKRDFQYKLKKWFIIIIVCSVIVGMLLLNN